MDQKVQQYETKDLDVYFAQLLGMAARKKNDRAKGLKMVLGDGFIDCFFFTPICLGKMVDELPETNMFQLKIDLFEDFFLERPIFERRTPG